VTYLCEHWNEWVQLPFIPVLGSDLQQALDKKKAAAPPYSNAHYSRGYFEKSDILFKFKAHEEFHHRHITDISESHSVCLPEDKILSATMKLSKKAIFQGSLES